MAAMWEEVPGRSLTLSKQGPKLTVPFRMRDRLPQTIGGDYFNFVASAALSFIQGTYPWYDTPHGRLYWNDIQVSERFYAAYYDITVSYSPNEKSVGAYQISVDTSGGTVNVKQGTVISKFGANAPANLADVPTTIGVVGEDIRGVDVPISEMKVTITFRHPQGILNHAYIRAVGELTGFPNSDPFLLWDQHEVMYRGGNFSESNTEATAAYNFVISYNATNVTVAGITGINKPGWAILDPVYKDDEKDDRLVKEIDYFKTMWPGDRSPKAYASVFGWGAP